MKIGRAAIAAGLLAAVAHSDLHATSTAGGFYTGLGCGLGWRNYVGKTTIPAANYAPALALANDVDMNGKLRKGKSLLQLFVGYNFSWDSFTLGFELQAGYHLGRMKKTFNLTAAAAAKDSEVTAKAAPYIGALVHVGCNIAGVAIYAVGGVRFIHHNLRVRDTAAQGAAGAPAFNISEKRWKAHPCIGGRLQYEFSQGYFVRLDYLHTLKKKVKSIAKYSDDILSLGAGVKL
jgi:hypothetical protein